MIRLPRKFVASVAITLATGTLLVGCSASRTSNELVPEMRIDLSKHGLPRDFFRADADTKCAGQIIGYE